MAKKTEKTCKNCGKVFCVLESYLRRRIKRGNKSSGIFCCLDCMHKYRKNNCYGVGKCKICGKIFRYKKSAYSGNYCSKRCAGLSHGKPESWETKKCVKCGGEFTAKVYQKQKYCSQKCSGKERTSRIKKKCEWCEKTYETRSIRKDTSRFCSRKCLNNWLSSDKKTIEKRAQALKERLKNKENHPFFGKHHEKEAKEKISQANKGRNLGKKYVEMYGEKRTKEISEKISTGNMGKTHSVEIKKKMSKLKKEYLKNNPDAVKRGENHPRWGKTRPHTEEEKQKMRELWKNPEYIEKVTRAIAKRPTAPEQAYSEIAPEIIRYVGNRAWWRLLPNGKYKNPDFKVTGQNKVIEIFGRYWHKNDDPQELIDLYKLAGIDCLVFWDNEIYEQPDLVLKKTNKFIANGII